MSAPDPATGGDLFPGPNDEDLRTAAVDAVAAVLQRVRPGPKDEALRDASDWLDLAMEVSPRRVAVLVQGSHPDCYRLADAVRRTAVGYDGRPTTQDIAAARHVIEMLLRPEGSRR